MGAAAAWEIEPPTRSIPTSSNMPAAKRASSPNCSGTPQPGAESLKPVLDRGEMGCHTASNLLGYGLFASTNPRNGAKPMRQVRNRADAKGRVSAGRCPLYPNPCLLPWGLGRQVSLPNNQGSCTRNQISYQSVMRAIASAFSRTAGVARSFARLHAPFEIRTRLVDSLQVV